MFSQFTGKSYSRTLVSVAFVKGMRGLSYFVTKWERSFGRKKRRFLKNGWQMRSQFSAHFLTIEWARETFICSLFRLYSIGKVYRNRPCKTEASAFFASVTNIAPRMHIVSDPYFKGRNHAHVNHDILGPVLSATLCHALFRPKWNKLKSYLKRPLSLSLLNHLRNKAEFVANPKPI